MNSDPQTKTGAQVGSNVKIEVGIHVLDSFSEEAMRQGCRNLHKSLYTGYIVMILNSQIVTADKILGPRRGSKFYLYRKM